MGTKKGFFSTFIFLAAVFILGIFPGWGHDLWINVDRAYLKAGEETKFFIAFGHHYPQGEIVLKKEDVEIFSHFPGGVNQRIDTHEEEKFRVGKVEGKKEGTIILSAYRKRKGTPTTVPSEKFAKTIIQVGNKTDQIFMPLGHRIELVPLKHPIAIKPGDIFPIRVVYEGKPLSTFVYATYEGFRTEDEPFSSTTKSDEEGIARIKIDRVGRWIVLCNHQVNFSYTLTFEVRP